MAEPGVPGGGGRRAKFRFSRGEGGKDAIVRGFKGRGGGGGWDFFSWRLAVLGDG